MRAVALVWIRRSVLLVNALALVVGIIIVIASAYLAKQQITSTLLSLVGGAIVSAAVVTLVLGAMAVRETVAQVDSAVLRGLQEVLGPIRDPVFEGALVGYRWDCLLTPPLPEDPHPDYVYQSMRISYRIDTLPPSLKVVCAASRDDRALKEFAAEDHILRWLVDDDLDPTDPAIFKMGSVRVDGVDLQPRPAGIRKVPGGDALTLIYAVPRRLRGTAGHSIDFQVLVRKFFGQETRVRIQAQLFDSVTDAEYRLTADSGLRITRMIPSASEISVLGAERAATCASTYTEPFERHAALVRLPFPLQPGSTVAFLIDREPQNTRA